VSRPGPWLRLTALFAGLSTLLAVVSGAASLGAAHRVLAALALPPLVALVVAAVLVHRRLLVPAASAVVLFGIAALVTAPGLHLALAAVAFAASLVLAAAHLSRRTGAARILARLRDADEAADHVAAAHHRAVRDVRAARRAPRECHSCSRP